MNSFKSRAKLQIILNDFLSILSISENANSKNQFLQMCNYHNVLQTFLSNLKLAFPIREEIKVLSENIVFDFILEFIAFQTMSVCMVFDINYNHNNKGCFENIEVF